ncbi:MAG: carboxymuconolactone decarboxylase family protein [Pseudomonadota bacterium]
MKQEPTTPTDSTIQILNEIGRAFGRVPNLFQAYAKYPPLLEANWNKVKLILLDGKLTRFHKEVIALLVSHDNGCNYCVAAHSAALKSMGMKNEQLIHMKDGYLAGYLNEREIELVNFARKANQRHHDIGASDFDKLASAGYAEAAIVEALGVVELFAGFNRFARAMRIEADF